jgi:transposase
MRPKYQRDGLRCASDTTDEEWALIEPHIPPAASCGRTRGTSMREVVNSIFYIAQTGCQWRLLPKNFPRTRRCSGTFMIGGTMGCGRSSGTVQRLGDHTVSAMNSDGRKPQTKRPVLCKTRPIYGTQAG